MLTLFPAYKRYLGAGGAVLFMIAAILLRSRNWPFFALLVLLGGIILFAAAEGAATLRHRRYLAVMYSLCRPEEFIAMYEPLLQCDRLRPNIRVTLLAYLSNGYAAAGNFVRAGALLDDAAGIPLRRAEERQRLLAGNRCNLHLWSEDLDRAREQYSLLEALGARTGEQRKTLSRLQTHIALLEGSCAAADAAILQEQITQGGSPYHVAQLNLLLGQIYLQLEKPEFAQEYLKRAAGAPGSLWVSAQAKRLQGGVFS